MLTKGAAGVLLSRRAHCSTTGWRHLSSTRSGAGAGAGAGMSGSATGDVAVEAQKQSMLVTLQNLLRWSPTSRKDIIESEKRLLTLVK